MKRHRKTSKDCSSKKSSFLFKKK